LKKNRYANIMGQPAIKPYGNICALLQSGGLYDVNGLTDGGGGVRDVKVVELQYAGHRRREIAECHHVFLKARKSRHKAAYQQKKTARPPRGGKEAASKLTRTQCLWGRSRGRPKGERTTIVGVD